MALHRLTQIVMGVPNVEQTAAYYAEFGLTHGENGTFTTVDGGEQLRIVPAASRRLVRLGVGADDPDDLDRVAASLAALGVPAERTHNVLVQQAPVAYLHHTSWQVDDVDEVGRGASAMLAADPGRHVWGLGRHHVGSNFFWYLRDPAGNFSEYYSDLDCIIDDALWQPGVWEGARGLYSWGPPPPPSFLAPDDLAALMTGAHSLR
jgi:hypothetical protein